MDGLCGWWDSGIVGVGMGRISLGGGQRRGDGPVISRSARRGGRVFIEYLLIFFSALGGYWCARGSSTRLQDHKITLTLDEGLKYSLQRGMGGFCATVTPDRPASIHPLLPIFPQSTVQHYADDPSTAQRERDSYYRGMGRTQGEGGRGEEGA